MEGTGVASLGEMAAELERDFQQNKFHSFQIRVNMNFCLHE